MKRVKPCLNGVVMELWALCYVFNSFGSVWLDCTVNVEQ